MNTKAIDPDDELFWRELKDAVIRVEISNSIGVVVTRNTRCASVGWDETDKSVLIKITEVDPHQPALLVP